jgi:long-subunit acyl-CoA synthetase (AMP-forming)
MVDNFFLRFTLRFILCHVKQGSTIGLYFINRPEWIIVDHACSAYSYISVPLYDTLGIILFSN